MPNKRPKRLVGCDLIALAARQPAGFVQMCERHYAERVDTLAEEITTSGRTVVMLTGPSATGKTTSAHKLADAVNGKGKKSTVISLDDFFVGEGRYPKRADGTDDYECLEALDVPLIRRSLEELCRTGCCTIPLFDFITQRPNGNRVIDCAGGVVIVEGLHALNPELTSHLPEKAVLNVYASLQEEYAGPDGRRCLATRDIRLARRMVRDWLFRGHAPEFTLDLWPHVCAGEEQYIKPFKSRADLVLDTTLSYETCLWHSYLEPIGAKNGASARLKTLQERFARFAELDAKWVPADSLLREFIGKNA